MTGSGIMKITDRFESISVLKAAKALDGQVAFFYISASDGAFARFLMLLRQLPNMESDPCHVYAN